MDNMTAEQALDAVHDLIGDPDGIADNMDLMYKLKQVESFLSAIVQRNAGMPAPSLPDGWSIKPYDEGEFVIKSPTHFGQMIITCTYGDYSSGTRTLVALCRAILAERGSSHD